MAAAPTSRIRLATRIVRRVALAGVIVTAASAAYAFGSGAQDAPDSPELTMAKAIMRDAPTSGFVETAASTRVGSSGPLNGAAIMSPGYDALSGLSLSFVGQGYQRYWANKTAGGLVGIIGIQLPADKTPSTFLDDFDTSMKALDAKAGSVKELKGAKQATVSISGGQMHEIAFVQGNQAFIILGTGATVSTSTVLEIALRQQGYAGASAGAAATAGTQTADRATTNAPTLPNISPAAAATTEGGFKRFLRTWVRLGCASLIVAGIGLLVVHFARPKVASDEAAIDDSMGLAGPMPQTANGALQHSAGVQPYTNGNALNPYVSQ